MKIRQMFVTCIITFLSVLTFTQNVFAEQEKSFYKGNTFYEEGQYDRAIKEYSRLLEQGLESGNLYYNLGNSYFKKGDLGKAMLYYERARRLIPRDSDLKSNYRFASSKIAYNFSEESSWLKRAFESFNIFSVNELAIVLSGVFTSIFLFLIAGIFIHKLKRSSYIVLPLLIVLFITFAYSLYNRTSSLDSEAIILSEHAEAKYEPADNATTHFTLYEGMKAYVLESKKEWVKIRRPDGKIGWIRNGDMEKI